MRHRPRYEPHGAQDLGKGDQEKLVSFILKSDQRDIHPIPKASLNHFHDNSSCRSSAELLQRVTRIERT